MKRPACCPGSSMPPALGRAQGSVECRICGRSIKLYTNHRGARVVYRHKARGG